MTETTNEYKPEFNPLTKLFLLTFYISAASFFSYILYKMIFPVNMFYSFIDMFFTKPGSLIEKAVILLCAAVAPVFTWYIYTYSRLASLLLQVKKNECHVTCGPGYMRYSTPDLYKEWNLNYNTGFITVSEKDLTAIYTEDVWSKFVMIPVKRVHLEFRDREPVALDLLFFKGDLSLLKDNIYYSLFPGKKAEAIESGLIEGNISYREGESIIDQNGNFIHPD